MLADLLLAPIPDLHLAEITLDPQSLTLHLAATSPMAACPVCAQDATRVHSHYVRHPADLPWAGQTVHYQLHVRRFFCETPTCSRRIFAERFGPALRVYARRTTRLASQLQQFGLTIGGAAGAVLATLVGMPISPSTLLRLIRAAELPAAPTPRVLGLDDFAWRKGQTYGTILVDLERQTPVDLLPDREAATVATWLQEHPGVEIISRDRAPCYVEGATLGAPTALQVADRFHLLQNLGDAVQRLVERHPAALRAVTEQLAELMAVTLADQGATTAGNGDSATGNAAEHAPGTAPEEEQSLPPRIDHPAAPVCSTPSLAQPVKPQVAVPPTAEVSVSATQQRFAAIKELQVQGLGQREIARRLDLNRQTVRRYMVADQVPERTRGHQMQSRARVHLPYLRERWAAGCQNALILWKELQQRGYKGSYASVYRLLRRYVGRPTGGAPGSAGITAGGKTAGSAPVQPLTARAARWLLLRKPTDLNAHEEQQRQLLCAQCPALTKAYELGQGFVELIRERRPEGLDGWLKQARESGIAELQNFARGLQRDYAAVRAAMEQPFSQGQVEGQVNRLKMLKRSMFGRAKFDLLRKRVLHRT